MPDRHWLKPPHVLAPSPLDRGHIGDQVFADDDERKRAYKAAIKLATNDGVKLSGIYLREAA